MQDIQYIYSPTSEISRPNKTSSLVGVEQEAQLDDSAGWSASRHHNYNIDDDTQSIISSRDPGLPHDILLQSYNKYVWYNGFRFIFITIILMVVAFCRHYDLYNHYNDNLCCFCYQQASQHTSTIFEWQTCYYDININDPNHTCQFDTPIYPYNISTNYTLFLSSWYDMVTASILFGIAIIYVIFTFLLTCRLNSAETSLSKLPLELMISYNIFMSTLCIYQLTINYQFYADENFKNVSGKQCYVSSFNKNQDNAMNYILIAAFLYILTTIGLVCGMYYLKYHGHFTVYRLFERIYNWLFFGVCSSAILLLFGFALFITFGVILTHFIEKNNWTDWIVIIILDISLFMSLIDIWFFTIFHTPRNPFKIVMKSNNCLKVCCRRKHVPEIQNHKFGQIITASCDTNDTFVN